MSPSAAAPNTDGLTSRQVEILELVAIGDTNRKIAVKLFIFENTVKKHLKYIMGKLHFQNRVQLATFTRNHQGESVIRWAR